MTKLDYATVVQITINPKVSLYLAEDGSVVDVEYLNEDAKNAFSDLKITGTKFEEAVSMIVDTSAKEGYLTEGKTISVDFVETTAEETTIETLTGNVHTAVRDALTEIQLSATLEIKVEGKMQDSFALEPEAMDKQDESGQQTVKNPCSACDGSGICPECGGGTLPCKRCGGSLWESCGVCGGSGRQSCPGCHGSGTDSTSGSACRHCGGTGTK